MKTRDEFITEYARSHRNLTNQIIHLVCVPLIFFASAGLLWAVDLDGLLPGFKTTTGWAPNLALLAFIPILGFYARLGFRSLLTGFGWSATTLLLIALIEASGAPLVPLCAAIWIGAWVFQFVGHHIEKAKPSFGDDIVFLLIGPLYVQEKFHKLIAHRSLSAIRG